MSPLLETWLAAGVVTEAQASEIERILTARDVVSRNEAIGTLATAALAAVATSETAPASARAQAGRTLAEMSGALVKSAPRTVAKPVSEMSLAEIEARIAALSGAELGNAQGDLV